MADRGRGDSIGDPRDKDTRVRDYETCQGRQRGSIRTGEERRGAAPRDTGPRIGGTRGSGRSCRVIWLGLLAFI
ncbi:hypothetical protein [Methanobacterium sp. ACI-7]|uniref:hypothetical protein n=1 Tax=unclassified Methanobacterium TaxID=2627676 RepID=UPI0039C479A8